MNLSEENKYTSIIKTPKKIKDTIIIDNGTYEIKCGYEKDLCMVFKNQIFKNKRKAEFEAFPSSQKQTMFEDDCIVNTEVFGLIADKIVQQLKGEKATKLILTITPHLPTKEILLDYLFSNYKFDTIQLGYDFIYSYLNNYNDEDCLIFSFSYSAVFVAYVKDKRIDFLQKVPIGASDLVEYINKALHLYYKDFKKDYSSLIKHMRVAEDYKKESIQIYEEMCQGNYQRCLFLTEEIKQEEQETAKKLKESTVKVLEMPEIDYRVLETEDAELNSEEKKMKKKLKIIFFATMARVKMKIAQTLEKMKHVIEENCDELEKITDLNKFIQTKKSKFEAMKKNLKARENLRKNAKNRKTREFIIKNKEANLTQEELEIQQQIFDAEDMDQEDELISKLNEAAALIKSLDPDFIPFYANTVEIIRGDNLGRQCVNIDLIKWPEILFNPSILRKQEMGVSEIIENVTRKYKVENAFITGGLCHLKGLKQRIYNEIICRLSDGKLNIKVAKNSQTEAFEGARFSDFFETFLKKDWKNKL
ncbi:Arp5 [Nucleospora cyclopteri]